MHDRVLSFFCMSSDFPATPDSDANHNIRDADQDSKPEDRQENEGHALAPPDADRVANSNAVTQKNIDETPDALASPSDAGAAGDPYADLSNYKRTIGQAIDRFVELGRAAPKPRTMQDYCKDGKVDCYKLQTTREGKPITEWLVNDPSLDNFILMRPNVSDASDSGRDTEEEGRQPEDSTPTDEFQSPERLPTVKATQSVEESGGARRSSEDRTVVDMVIENAKLTAEAKGKDLLIEEMRDDKAFLREELREARKDRGDVKDLAERLLITHERVALGGVLEEPASSPNSNKNPANQDDSEDP